MDYIITESTRKIAARIMDSDSICIIGHVNPDGDCIGSTIGLHLFLKELGKDSTVILPNDIPENLKFISALAEEGKYITYESRPETAEEKLLNADTIFYLDLNSASRTRTMEDILLKSKAVNILIDHHTHPAEEQFSILLSDSRRSSTCEYIYDTCRRIERFMQEEKGIGRSLLTLDCMRALFSGILTDTNVFANSVTPETLNISAEMISLGVDKEDLQQRVTGGYRVNRLSVISHLLSQVHVIEELHLAYMVFDLKTQAMFDYAKGESEGIVNMPLTIKGIEISALFTEDPGGYLRASLRSKGMPVNEFTKIYFEGGGHVKASGGRTKMDIDKVGAYFEKAIKEYFYKA